MGCLNVGGWMDRLVVVAAAAGREIRTANARSHARTHLHAELAAGLDDGGLNAPEVLVVDAGEEVVLCWA